jgi:hypothetical protein
MSFRYLFAIVLVLCSCLWSSTGLAAEPNGAVLVVTDGAGKIRSISVVKSTGSAKVDARALQFAKTTFY